MLVRLRTHYLQPQGGLRKPVVARQTTQVFPYKTTEIGPYVHQYGLPLGAKSYLHDVLWRSRTGKSQAGMPGIINNAAADWPTRTWRGIVKHTLAAGDIRLPIRIHNDAWVIIFAQP